MPLSRDESAAFFKMFFSLLAYVNEKFELLDHIYKPDEMRILSPESIGKVRDALYKHLEVIDFFVLENPNGFSSDELDIIESWHKYIKRSFYVVSHLKNYSVFLDIIDPPKAYAVHSFDQPFLKIIGKNLPAMTEVILLPYKDKIICDSIIDTYSYRPNREMLSIIKNAYTDAKMKFGIIQTINASPREKKMSNKELLKFYLRSKKNRELYRFRIEELKRNYADLEYLYYQEMNKIHAREIKKIARGKGERDIWYGIVNSKVVSTGPDEEYVKKQINENLSDKLRALSYIFKV